MNLKGCIDTNCGTNVSSWSNSGYRFLKILFGVVFFFLNIASERLNTYFFFFF